MSQCGFVLIFPFWKLFKPFLIVHNLVYSQIQQAYPTVLASNVENMWQCSRTAWPNASSPETPLRRNGLWESLWLHCGALGMRIWLPLFPHQGEKSFMAKRIMLPVPVSIYPLGNSSSFMLQSTDPVRFYSYRQSLQLRTSCKLWTSYFKRACYHHDAFYRKTTKMKVVETF